MFLRAAAILWPGRAFARKGHLERDGALPKMAGFGQNARGKEFPAVAGRKLVVVGSKDRSGRV